MKIKSYLLATLLTITLFSCSKDNENTNESNVTSEKQVLNFSSKKEMQAKIAEIESFKKNQESQILEKLLKRNNLKAPTENDIKKLNTNTAIDKIAILEDVKFYHQEKLKAIYAERAHFGFISIQSIADEINFNKLINQKLYQKLIQENKNLLFKFNHQYYSVYDNISNILIPNAKISISNKQLDLNDFKIDTLLDVNKYSKTGILDTGIVCFGYNNFIAITYQCIANHCESFMNYGTPAARTLVSLKLQSLVWSTNGYVLYPCWFYTDNTSYCDFNAGYLVNMTSYRKSFPLGIGDTVISDYYLYNGNNCIDVSSVSGKVSGNFAIPINGNPAQGFLRTSGTKIF